MIERHPRWGFAVVGGVLATLVVLGALIVVAGGGAEQQVRSFPGAEVGTAPAAVGPARAAAAADRMSRSGGRDRLARLRTVDPLWAERTGAAAGVPTTAMVAYGTAQLRMAQLQPRCNLSWNTLAGIGWIESQHGTLAQRVLQPDGTSVPPVIGPALDGNGFAAIRSTSESAAWHGDPTWEHAVGPMQFIASSWERWGADGDGDGAVDPMDLHDAAWAAARYLCADGKDLATASGWSAAVHSYNHDDTYVRNVAAAANAYAQRTSG